VQDGRPSLYVYADPGSYEPLARIDGKPGSEAIFYFHTNLAGLPEQLTNTDGHTVWHSEYQAWGRTRNEWHDQQPGREQNLRFQGQYLDRETGLHYNTFRFYDPDVGRFTQPDPIGLAGGLNLYQYAPNAIGWIDPLGLSGFFNSSTFSAPSGSTHIVYQQNIDWNLPINTRSGNLTNLDIASQGGSPFVVKNGKYSQLNLHHSKQDGLGSLFELSSDTHVKYRNSNALHPHLPNAHPTNPVNRDTFNLDRAAYWKARAQQELDRRASLNKRSKSNKTCG